MAFKNVVVCFTGLTSEEKAAEEARITSMGGEVVRELTQKVDILVAKNCDTSPKYRAACCWNIPICGRALIDAMAERTDAHVSEFVSPQRNDFRLPIFTGCVVCSSGVTTDEQTAIGHAVEENGGRYVLDLTQGETTHLITEKLTNEKYKHARKWGDVKIVNLRWLRKSLDRGIRLPEEYYNPDPQLNKVAKK
ncbi:hypothetical protein M3Y99_01823300 [Aphelenchoides fujianensis]|nr:hypothetical protein M3Y99_01823300 [Aphelenchoides fujianensis]